MVIAVAQLAIEERGLDVNEARCREALRRAAEAGAELLVLPECALTGYRYETRDDAFAVALSGAERPGTPM